MVGEAGEARGRRCHSSSARKGAKGARRRSPSSAQLSRVWRVSAASPGPRNAGLAASCGMDGRTEVKGRPEGGVEAEMGEVGRGFGGEIRGFGGRTDGRGQGGMKVNDGRTDGRSHLASRRLNRLGRTDGQTDALIEVRPG